MTEAEWNRSDDAGAMLDFLWQRRGVSPDEIDLRFGGDVKALHLPRPACSRLSQICSSPSGPGR